MSILVNRFLLKPSLYSEALWNKRPTAKELVQSIQKANNKNVTFNSIISTRIIRNDCDTPLPPTSIKMKEPSVNALPPAKTRAMWSKHRISYDLPPQPKLIEPKALLTAPPSLVEIFGGLKAEDVIDDGSLAEDEFLSRSSKLLETFEKMRNLMKIAYG